MRTWLYNLIKAITGLPGTLENRVYASGSQGEADRPDVPFIMVHMGIEQPVLGSTEEMSVFEVPFDVVIHDDPGSMLNIDDAAIQVKNSLPTAAPAQVGNVWVYRLKWEDTGADAFDDHFLTNTRRVSFRMTARR